jgi:GNAT superfamily N-acetyltransferase
MTRAPAEPPAVHPEQDCALTVRQAQSAIDWSQARALLKEYEAGLEVDLGFQGFAAELSTLEQHYGPPRGLFLLAGRAGSSVGCVGLRELEAGVGELKRLYVVPQARGRGGGRALLEGLIARARRLGYRRLRLDTLPAMAEARALYVAQGFWPTAAYRHNPVPGAEFFELELSGAASG